MKLIITIFVIITLAACSPQYIRFTQSLRNKVNLSDEELKQLQFYVCPDLLIQRSVLSGESNISKRGKLIIKSGRQVHEILIPKLTPGLVMYSKDGHIGVSFERGTTISFTGARKLRAGDYIPYGLDNTPQVEYDGNKYDVLLTEKDQECQGYDGAAYNGYDKITQSYIGKEARLWIDAESFMKFQKERTTLEGLRLPE